MQITFIDDFYAITRITGPRHNHLQVRLGRGVQSDPECEQLPACGNCRHKPLDEQAIIANILEGVARINQELNVDYCVTHVRYLENDTKPEVVYGAMTVQLIRHLEQGGELEVESIK